MALSHKKLVQKRQKKKKKKKSSKSNSVTTPDFTMPHYNSVFQSIPEYDEIDGTLTLSNGDIFETGDLIEINKMYIDDDTLEDLIGYRGRIVTFEEEDDAIEVEWDKETQQRIPDETLNWCKQRDSNPNIYYFSFADVDCFTKIKDHSEDVSNATTQ